MDAKKIWSYARRLLAIIPSIFICALGVALLVWPEWGCDPLTTFEIGLSNVFHVQFGTVALVFEGIMFFVFFFVRRDFDIGLLYPDRFRISDIRYICVYGG